MSITINQDLIDEINKVLYNKEFSQFLVEHTTDPAIAMVILQLLFDGVTSMQQSLDAQKAENNEKIDEEEKM